MEQLPHRQRLQQPTPKPPRPIPLPPILRTPDQPIGLAHIVAKLEGSEDGVDGDGHAHLLRRVDAQRETREGCAEGGGIGRGEGCRGSGVAQAEGLDLGVEEMHSQTSEEAE